MTSTLHQVLKDRDVVNNILSFLPTIEALNISETEKEKIDLLVRNKVDKTWVLNNISSLSVENLKIVMALLSLKPDTELLNTAILEKNVPILNWLIEQGDNSDIYTVEMAIGTSNLDIIKAVHVSGFSFFDETIINLISKSSAEIQNWYHSL